jgi:hypothetical protein
VARCDGLTECAPRQAPAEPELIAGLGALADELVGFSGADLNFVCERAVQVRRAKPPARRGLSS